MVKPKKHLGQHFLNAPDIAERIAGLLVRPQGYQKLLEIGPGTGALTQYLLSNPDLELYAVEMDVESIMYLQRHFPALAPRLLQADFLQTPWPTYFGEDTKFGIIGNFPYNISSQIFFKVLEYRQQVPEVVGMLQKEVAERLAAPPGSKTYGILSVLLQAYYEVRYCFTVPPEVFIPPPQVQSAVVHLQRNQTQALACDERKFFTVVKMAFQQRRKTLRNALKGLAKPGQGLEAPIFDRRAETLSVSEFVALTNFFFDSKAL
ncbi:MAG: 16S rRNA (adenine(1518)-N(6)/adenine(1519)-N(6)) -dimethyltransferase RsmA [Microscillaceae bacterium]